MSKWWIGNSDTDPLEGATVVKVGDRVEMIGVMPDDPDPIPVGTRGTVEEIPPGTGQIWVDWDPDAEGRKRSLVLLVGDPYRVVRDE